MSNDHKPLVWMGNEIQTPPMSEEARREAGFLLRKVQAGEMLKRPHGSPMPSIGRKVHEVVVDDADGWWRIIYRIDDDAIVIGDVFHKKTNKTPRTAIDKSKNTFKRYDNACR